MNYTDLSIKDLAGYTKTVQTPDDVLNLQKAIGHRLHLPELRNALFERFTSLLADQPQRVSTSCQVQQDGISYDLSQWITFSEYAKLYGLRSTNIINNWLSRGLVPSDCIVELRQLNGLKLIRSQPYKAISQSLKHKINVSTKK